MRMLGAAHGQAAQLGQVFQLAAGLGQAADPALARGQAQFQLFESVEQLLDQPAMPGKVGRRLAQRTPLAVQLGQPAVVLRATPPQVADFLAELAAFVRRLAAVLATQPTVLLQALQQFEGHMQGAQPGFGLAAQGLLTQAGGEQRRD